MRIDVSGNRQELVAQLFSMESPRFDNGSFSCEVQLRHRAFGRWFMKKAHGEHSIVSNAGVWSASLRAAAKAMILPSQQALLRKLQQVPKRADPMLDGAT